MLPKTILIIILSAMLLVAGQTPAHFEAAPFAAVTPPPPPGDGLPPPPDDNPLPPDDNEPPSDGDGWLQSILDSLESAWQGITGWIDGAIGDLQEGFDQAINQFLQGLIDDFTQQVNQMLKDLLNQTCGTALLLPPGAVAGVWLLSRRKGKVS